MSTAKSTSCPTSSWLATSSGSASLGTDGAHARFRVHVHVCTAGSDWERRPLPFRDWLRYDRSDRAAYKALKNQLAQEDWPDMNAYAEAKDPLITEITARAGPISKILVADSR